MAKTILQGTVKEARRRRRQKRWEDNIKEWTGMEGLYKRWRVPNMSLTAKIDNPICHKQKSIFLYAIYYWLLKFLYAINYFLICHKQKNKKNLYGLPMEFGESLRAAKDRERCKYTVATSSVVP